MTGRRTPSPVVGFLIDFGLAAVILFGLSLLTGLIWGMVRGMQIGADAAARGLPTDDITALTQQLGQPGPLIQVLMALVATGGAAVILYFARRRATATERQHSLAAIARASTWGWILLVALCVVVGSNGIAWAARQFGVQPVPTNLDLMTRAVEQFPIFLGLFAVLIAPAYEEVLFRRVLFGRLWQAGRPLLGALLSSLAFALVHEIPGVSGNGLWAMLQLWLVYGGMGAAFCWLYQRTGTLLAPIAAHALNNAIALGVLMLAGAP